MKRTILKASLVLSVALIFAFSKSFGQLTYGAKLGLTLSTETGSGTSGAGFKAGFHIGGYGTYWIQDNIGIQAELLYNGLGAKSTESSTISEYGSTVSSSGSVSESLSYLQIPVLFVYKINGLSFHAGPYFGFLLGAKESGTVTETITEPGVPTQSTSTSLDQSGTTGLSSIDFGVAIGATYELDNNINFGVRLEKGLTNVAASTSTTVNGTTTSTSPGTINNLGIMISVGYTFGKK